MPKGMEYRAVRISAPLAETCATCATVHDPGEPHDLNSLYYQNQFFKAHKRFPSWADAMNHCDPMIKAVWCEKLKKIGITVTFPTDPGGKA